MIIIHGKGNYKSIPVKQLFALIYRKQPFLLLRVLEKDSSRQRGKKRRAMQDIRSSMRQMRNFPVPKQKIQKQHAIPSKDLRVKENTM